MVERLKTAVFVLGVLLVIGAVWAGFHPEGWRGWKMQMDGPTRLEMVYEPDPPSWSIRVDSGGKRLTFDHADGEKAPMVFVDWLLATKSLILFAEKAKMEPIPRTEEEALKRLLAATQEDLDEALR